MAKGIPTSRQIIAAKQRLPRYSRTHTYRVEASGIAAETIHSEQEAEVVEKRHESLTYYEIKSKFTGGAFVLRKLENGEWFFCGDERLKAMLVVKVETFIASQEMALEVADGDAEIAETIAEAMQIDVKRAKFNAVCAEVRAIETEYSNCAWCGDLPDENGSHGICQKHANELEEQARARKARLARTPEPTWTSVKAAAAIAEATRHSICCAPSSLKKRRRISHHQTTNPSRLVVEIGSLEQSRLPGK